jgi:hypothetical protein
MSLDVTLKDPTATYEVGYLYDANITHNLTEMAGEASIYKALWRPYQLKKEFKKLPKNNYTLELTFERECVTLAKDIIPILKKGLKDLKARPEYFETFNSPNGWGMYEHFVPFVEKYLEACKKYPESIIIISR